MRKNGALVEDKFGINGRVYAQPQLTRKTPVQNAKIFAPFILQAENFSHSFYRQILWAFNQLLADFYTLYTGSITKTTNSI